VLAPRHHNLLVLYRTSRTLLLVSGAEVVICGGLAGNLTRAGY